MSFMDPALAPATLTAFDGFVAANPPAQDDIEEARYLLTSGIVPDTFLARAAFAMAWAVLRHDFARRRRDFALVPHPAGDAA